MPRAKAFVAGTTMTLALAMGTSSCSLFSSGNAQKTLDQDAPLQQSAADSDSYDDYDEDDANPLADQKNQFPHPPMATAMSTLTLTRIHPQPEASRLIDCQDSLNALVEEAGNQQDMIAVQAEVVNIAKGDLLLYHWCFYSLMVNLDQDLSRAERLMDERAQTFFRGMKALWVLAQSLDRLVEGDTYFSYLRQRYVSLSREMFGRELEVVSSPLDNERLFYRDGGKAAAPAH